MFYTVPVEPEHLIIIEQWYKHYGYSKTIMNALSDTGFICYKDDIPCAAGWVYLPLNSDWVFYECLIANPDVIAKDRLVAVNLVIDTSIQYGMDLGYRFHSIAADKRIGKRIGLRGFSNSGTNLYVKTIH